MTENQVEDAHEPHTVYIFRLDKARDFTMISNFMINDASLSWEARGLQMYLLSKPDDWKVRLYDLIARGPAGEHKIQRMLRELEDAGYLLRKRFRRKDGTFAWLIIVLEHPSLFDALGLEKHFGPPERKSPTPGSSTGGLPMDG